jgi:acyl-coenzyme A synthetase/AMP-(fatty) acid ligase
MFILIQTKFLLPVGEPLNREAWEWFYEVIGEERCDICDTWWQTGNLFIPYIAQSFFQKGIPLRSESLKTWNFLHRSAKALKTERFAKHNILRNKLRIVFLCYY